MKTIKDIEMKLNKKITTLKDENKSYNKQIKNQSTVLVQEKVWLSGF